MIKLIRTLAVENAWILRIFMGIIAVTFVITMGWWGFDYAKSSELGTVNGRPILYNEFQDQYDRIYRYYREIYQDRLTDDLLKQLDLKSQTVNVLVEEMLLLSVADREGIRISDEETREEIRQTPAFQRGGKFDRDAYLRVLQADRRTPEIYERELRDALRTQRVRILVAESVEVTEEEVREGYRRMAEQQKKPFKEEEFKQQREEIRRRLLADKQTKVLRSYLEALRKKADIRLNPEFLATPAT